MAEPDSDRGAESKELTEGQSARLADHSRILAINSGSSSLKFALFETTNPPRKIVSGRIERIGLSEPAWSLDRDGKSETRQVEATDHQAAAKLVRDWLEKTVGSQALAAVGHRVVHGGPRLNQPEKITPELIEELRRLSPLDPDHMASAIAVIETFDHDRPGLTQVACFDTAFHHDMPRVAQIVAIPRRLEAAGVRRYGFHGLSYQYLMEELERVAGNEAANGRVVLAHLGSGASLAAVKGRKSLDTSMAFTPAAGLVMGTRSGDIDPGLVRFLMQSNPLSVEQFDRMINKESGLLGVSETSSDIRDLLALEALDARAAEAVALFCYQAKKWIGAYAAVLGGVDTLVFAGGIGENSPLIRARICDGLEFLGIKLDANRNAAGEALISTDESQAKVRMIKTDEESMIARNVLRLMK